MKMMLALALGLRPVGYPAQVVEILPKVEVNYRPGAWKIQN